MLGVFPENLGVKIIDPEGAMVYTKSARRKVPAIGYCSKHSR